MFWWLLLCGASAQNRAPTQVLGQLMEGNERFCRGGAVRPHLSSDWRKGLSTAQHPMATILGCADSRVPPELVFDVGFGDLFVTRLAGNAVSIDVTGSLEYGIFHLHTPVVMVLGHEGCGAVSAAFGDYQKEPFPIQDLLKRIVPALLPVWNEPDRLSRGVQANVCQSVRELKSVQNYSKLIDSGSLLIVGGVYDLETGQVRLVSR